MKTKKGVILCGLHPMMQIANGCAAEIWAEFGKELVITEGVVIRDSGLHPLGRANDYRTYYFTASEKRLVAERLRKKLGKDYDVILKLKPPHIHCEYDPPNPKII